MALRRVRVPRLEFPERRTRFRRLGTGTDSHEALANMKPRSLIVVGISLVTIALLMLTSAPAANEDVLPDAARTPGAVAVTDVALICAPGYATHVRPRGALWRRLKNEAYDAYGLPRGKRSTIDARGKHHPAYEVDHLVPLELGGSPGDLHNLWPEPLASARRKDRVENELHDRVCAGTVPLGVAQRAIARDWRTALRATAR
jgi:hypothetical protein